MIAPAATYDGQPLDAPPICACRECDTLYTATTFAELPSAPTPADVARAFRPGAVLDSRRCPCGASVGIVVRS